MRRMMSVLGVAVSGAVLLTGCSLVGSSEKGDSAGPSASASGSTSTPADGSSQNGASQAPAAGKTTQSAQEPGTQNGPSITYSALGKDGTVTITSQGLKVNGKLATLTMLWQPKLPGSDDEWNTGAMSGGSSVTDGHVALVDTQNLKRYVPVQDSSDHAMSSHDLGKSVGNGRSLTTTDTFAAPAQGVTSVTVYVDDRRLFDVPVSR